MYAQVTHIQVPIDGMPQMRRLIEHDYLPAIRHRPGFVAGYLLEQVDDPEAAILVVQWENHESVENFNRTGSLEASVQALAARMPGVRVQREGFVVRVRVEREKAEV
jgi:heme-degrading monooxygenase HmoA